MQTTGEQKMGLNEVYANKRMTAAEIAGRIESDTVISSATALTFPQAIAAAIGERAKNGEIRNVIHHTTLEVGGADNYDMSYSEAYRGVSWHSGGKARKAFNEGMGDVMPAYFRDFPVIYSEYIPLDYAILTVSPMDEEGYFSTGTTGGSVEAIVKKANHIFLEVNEHMPYLPHSPLIHINNVEGFCENNAELPALPSGKIDEKSRKIGELIAERIPDGATIQLGIGGIPDAVGAGLKEKHHLGIHTEMFTDSMVELLKCGAADNSEKPIHTGRTVTAFAFGAKTMYDFMNHNPDIEMLSVDYVNDPAVIAQHDNFVSVNAAMEVDFFGQVCAESIGTMHYSGTGGQVDYVRGAVESKGGQSFIAFQSTSKNDTISKIKPILTPGAIVTTSKNDVDMIVTEYGIAKLRGRTLKERTRALIGIAHPKFREELTFEARKRNLLL